MTYRTSMPRGNRRRIYIPTPSMWEMLKPEPPKTEGERLVALTLLFIIVAEVVCAVWRHV